MNIKEAKIYVAQNGGLLPGESLGSALDRLSSGDSPDFELSRMKSVLQAGRTCHDCSCHVAPPCDECVNCLVCGVCSEHEVENCQECIRKEEG